MSPVCVCLIGDQPCSVQSQGSLVQHVCGCMPFVCANLPWITRPNLSFWVRLVLASQRAHPPPPYIRSVWGVWFHAVVIVSSDWWMHCVSSVLVITARTSSLWWRVANCFIRFSAKHSTQCQSALALWVGRYGSWSDYVLKAFLPCFPLTAIITQSISCGCIIPGESPTATTPYL